MPLPVRCELGGHNCSEVFALNIVVISKNIYFMLCCSFSGPFSRENRFWLGYFFLTI